MSKPCFVILAPILINSNWRRHVSLNISVAGHQWFRSATVSPRVTGRHPITGRPLTQQSQALSSVPVALPQSSVRGFTFAISADQSQLAFGKRPWYVTCNLHYLDDTWQHGMINDDHAADLAEKNWLQLTP